MNATRISQVFAGAVTVGSQITIEGWIRTRRDSKAGLSFLAVHDGSCHEALQVVAPAELPNYTADVLRITTGCAVRCTGEVVASQGKGQSVELRADRVEVVGWVDNPDTYPMQPKRHTMEYLREVAHLRPRTNIISATTRVRHTLAQAVHRFFHEQGFLWVHTPIITSSDAEGAGQMFRVSTLDAMNPPRAAGGGVDWSQDFFGKEARLTVSGQLNVETYAMALSKVYTFGPTFRAENSNTRRHLAEFWMIEPEIAFANLADDAQLAEDFLRSTSSRRCSRSAPTTSRSSRSSSTRRASSALDARWSTRSSRAMDLHRGDHHAREVGREVRVPREVGHRSAERARALSDGQGHRRAGRGHRTTRRKSSRSTCG